MATVTAKMTFEEYCRSVFDPKKVFSKPEPLKGTRFLSCTQYILGPSCANYLAELGAEVIKIELPRRGEPMRHTTPFNEPKLYPLSKWMPEMGTGLGFFGANHNEYFLAVDFHKPEGQEIVGMMAAFQILACMYWRDNISGLGNFMEYSQVQGAQRHLSDCIALYGRYGLVPQRWGNWDALLCVHGIIKCGKSSYPNSKNPQELEEGFILVSAYTDADFAKLMRLIRREDLEKKYATRDERIKAESQYEIYPALEEWAKDKTKEQVRDILNREGFNNQPVWNSKEVSNQEHFHLRGELEWLYDPHFGEVQSQGPAFHLSESPARHKWALKPVGADNEFILGKLCGFSKTKMAELEADGVTSVPTYAPI